MRPSFAVSPAAYRGGYAGAAVPRRADPARLQTLAGRTMGTTWSLVFDNPAMLPRETLNAAVGAALDRVIAQMSTWEPLSDISRYNTAEPGSRHVLKAEFAEVLGCALHWAEASGGAIDPTVGPLVALWGFGAHAAARALPSQDALDAAKSCTGWQRLAFDAGTGADAGSVCQPGGFSLDLSGVAKGFAVDHAVDALRSLGLQNLLMEVGGELRGVGRRPDGSPWRVRVDGAGAHAPTVALADLAVATSGDRWHVRAEDGRRLSHTIDPRSGEPVASSLVSGLASVTVLHAQCMQADALATVLTVLGETEGRAFADRHGIAALFVCREAIASDARRLIATQAWRALVD